MQGGGERSYAWPDPTQLAEEAATRSGLEYVRAMLTGELPHPPICATIGFRFTEVSEGRCTLEFEPAEYQYNPIGSVHGGVVAMLLDSAAGCAVHTTLPAGVGYTTVNLVTNFLRTVRSDSGTLRAEGSIVKGGRRISLAEATLLDADGRVYAHGTATCMIIS